MTRILILTLVLAPAVSLSAQQVAQPLSGSNWQHVQALPVGASVQVKARKSHTNCYVKSVDADSLTCTHGKDIVFERSEIRSIKIPHRGRSIGVGAAIGAGVGFGIGAGAAAATDNGGWFSGGGWDALSGAVAGVLGAAIGTVTGGLTDFTHSTVYKAP